MGHRLKISLGLVLLAGGSLGLAWTAARPLHPPAVHQPPAARHTDQAPGSSDGHEMEPVEMREMMERCERAMEQCRAMHEQMRQMMGGMMTEGMMPGPRPMMPGPMMGPETPMHRGGGR